MQATAALIGIVAALSIALAITRAVTGLKESSFWKSRFANAGHIPEVPYSIPFLGHTFQYILPGHHKWLKSLSDRYSNRIFAITVGGKKLNVVSSVDLAHAALSVRAPIEARPVWAVFMNKVWDDGGMTAAVTAEQAISLRITIEALNKDPFVSSAVASTAERIVKTMEGLLVVSPLLPAPHWQRRANTAVRADDGTFELSLFPLIRNYVGAMVGPCVFGSALFEDNPSLLDDLFTVDSKAQLMLMGMPRWVPWGGLREAYAARDRLKASMARLHECIVKEQLDGQRSDRFLDVPNFLHRRIATLEQGDYPAQYKTATHSALIWAMMVNANVMIFWMVFHIYQDKSLLQAIRKEVSPFILLPKPGDKVEWKIDEVGLKRHAVLLQSIFYECMRMYSLTTSLRVVAKDFYLKNEKVHHNQADNTENYLLRKGELIAVPHGMHDADNAIWPNAQTFDPMRFLATGTGPGAEEEGKKLNLGPLNVWGPPRGSCKGQKFAEKEVLLVVAALVSCWEIEPFDEVAGWAHPGVFHAIGAATPKRDVQVRMKRLVK